MQNQKIQYPEIRIKDAWLLRQNVSVHLHELWGKENSQLADTVRMKEVVDSYKEAWSPYEQRILSGICGVMGLEFRQNIIDVNIAPWFTAMSEPMVIGVIYDPDRFVEVLTHELTHRLLTDNIQTSYDTAYTEEWKRLFGADKNKNVLVHIPVHAVIQSVFDDILKEPERTERDKELCRQWPDYDAAWRYVEEHGYKDIINKLKSNYGEIETGQQSYNS